MALYSEELDRMEKITPEQMLKVELENEFGFSPIVARASSTMLFHTRFMNEEIGRYPY